MDQQSSRTIQNLIAGSTATWNPKKTYLSLNPEQAVVHRIIMHVIRQPPVQNLMDDHFETDKVSKVGDRSRGHPESSLFISYYIEMKMGHYFFPWITPPYLWSVPYNAEC